LFDGIVVLEASSLLPLASNVTVSGADHDAGFATIFAFTVYEFCISFVRVSNSFRQLFVKNDIVSTSYLEESCCVTTRHDSYVCLFFAVCGKKLNTTPKSFANCVNVHVGTACQLSFRAFIL